MSYGTQCFPVIADGEHSTDTLITTLSQTAP